MQDIYSSCAELSLPLLASGQILSVADLRLEVLRHDQGSRMQLRFGESKEAYRWWQVAPS